MNFIDSHAHIFSEEFREDFTDVLQRAEEKQVHRIMIVTTQPDEARQAMAFAAQDPYRFQVAYGIHPEDISRVNEEMIREMEEIVSDPGITAVGEIGLDYHWEPEYKNEQKELFIRQIEIARKVSKPILVHCRDAIQDTFDIMKEHRIPGLMHCFPGSAEMGIEFTKLGYYIALGGAATFKNARHALEVCRAIDPKYLLTETDCPYMAPVPMRGKRNEPSYIPYIVDVLARERGISAQEMAEIIDQNYSRFLGETNA
ncbi:MAG: TatD family hydrolase [Solobacterium sp.]|nr:TatD family hydrolase [Solobacterium sp.]